MRINSTLNIPLYVVAMKEGTEYLGMKLLAVAAVGVAAHLIWRWRRNRSALAPDQIIEDEQVQQPLLEPIETPSPTPPPVADSISPVNAAEEEHQHAASSAKPSIPLFSEFTAPTEPQPPPVHVDTAAAQRTPFSALNNVSSPQRSAGISPFAQDPPLPPPLPEAFSSEQTPASPLAAGPPATTFEADVQDMDMRESSAFAAELAPRDLSFGGWAAPPGADLTPPQLPPQARMERSYTLHSTASDRRLPRVMEEAEEEIIDDKHLRGSFDFDVRLALKLDVIAGPRMKSSYVTSDDTTKLTVGRLPDNDLAIADGEVSGRHVEMSWSSLQRCWQIADLGSLNGTQLNNESISNPDRVRGEQYRLCTDDIIQLGTITKLKVSVFPREMLPENSLDRSLSLSLGPGSLPRSLTMPKHRIPSFTSLLTPKINSPSKQAVVAAASDELRLECCIASATGRDHARRGQLCEDVALAECPLHGSEVALGSETPAALFCVFDGHCGRGAADAASIALPDEVSERLQTPEAAKKLLSGEGAHSLLRETFLATDERINSEEGCTATAVLAWRGSTGDVHLQCANVGDSAALLIDPESGSWKVLTEDHRLTNPAERNRLVQNGIPLHSDSRRLYGLNLARALGDRFLKDEDLGLSAEPAVSQVQSISLNSGAILVVASDGLWDVLDAEKTAGVVLGADKEEDGSVVEIAAAIVAAAKKAGTRDDVTALVVRLWDQDEWKLRSPLVNLDDGQAASFEAD